MTFKEQVYAACQQLLDSKILHVRQVLAELKYSAANETKSTAGDKHETALAMLQIEQKNAGIQLENLMAQKIVLDRIAPALIPVQVTPGALAKTNQGCFFLSIALGKVIVKETPVVVLSPQSPLGSKLMSLKTGDVASFNNISYIIKGIE